MLLLVLRGCGVCVFVWEVVCVVGVGLVGGRNRSETEKRDPPQGTEKKAAAATTVGLGRSKGGTGVLFYQDHGLTVHIHKRYLSPLLYEPREVKYASGRVCESRSPFRIFSTKRHRVSIQETNQKANLPPS